MSPAQDQAWENWIGTAYSGLYWQYAAARLGKIVVALNVISGLTGVSALALLLADHPLLTKLVALAASAVTLFVSYSGYQPGYEKAKIRAEFFSKLSLRYEQLWNRINQGLDESEISAQLDNLLAQEDLVPSVSDEEYDDQLRERVYGILVESKGLTTTATE
jgi:hypothetical protein